MGRQIYKAVGTALGLGLCSQLYKSDSLFYQCELGAIWRYDFMLNFGLVNFILIVCYMALKKVVFWTFGRSMIYNRQVIARFKESLQYTGFQFVCLAALSYLKDYPIHANAINLGMLLLLKNFHYIVELSHQRLTVRCFMHSLLTLVDFMIIYEIRHFHSRDFVILLFNYEVLQLLQSNVIHMLTLIYDKGGHQHENLFLEFGLNLAGFNLSLFYLYNESDIYLFIQLIPMVYRIFRLLLSKTRHLIKFLQDQQQFKRFDVQLSKDTQLRNDCFCLQDRSDQRIDIRILPCEHTFHYDCLKYWLVRSHSCPVCRRDVPLS